MRKFTNFLIFAITILIMNLISGFITEYFLNYRNDSNPLKFTAIGMAALVVVFYPGFEYLDGLVNKFTKKLIHRGRSFIGVIVILSIILFTLFCIYARIWFKVNVPDMIRNMII